MVKLPLEGIRIVDSTQDWSGPLAMSILATLGAEVIKVESIQHPERTRTLVGRPQAWEWGPSFNAINHSKLGITLNLNDPRAINIYKELVKVSDIVAENVRPGVMDGFGLAYEHLRKIKPDIIMLSMPGFGMTGPWKDYVAWALVIEQMSGLSHITGYEGGPPMFMGTNIPDATAGVTAVFALLLAIHHKRRTGKGQFIDLAQLEAVSSLIGEQIMEYTLADHIPGRPGNRHPYMAPHGVYPANGKDRWVTIAVANDDEWAAFCKAIGNPAWTKDERFADALSRWKNQEALDTCVGEWTSTREREEVQETLQKAGVAAAALFTHEETMQNPHLLARNFFQEEDRAVSGKHTYAMRPVKYSKMNVEMRGPAPLLGEHNDKVLGGILKMSQAEIEKLREDRVIGDTPLAILEGHFK